jgi:hypothetical protein
MDGVYNTNEGNENRLYRKIRYHFGDLDVDVSITLKCILKKQGVKLWAGYNWRRTGSNDGIL